MKMRFRFKPARDVPAVRPPAVAGQFYPADPEELRTQVNAFLSEANPAVGEVPKAIIAPHAGYIYSGPVAGSAYASLARGRDRFRRVVLLGPSHFVALEGLAASSATVFQSPLGPVPVDGRALAQVRKLPYVITLDAAHQREHSLEVHLPFLQIALAEFKLVPLVVGEIPAEEVGGVLDELWDGDATCIVISSDLSHYHDYRTAQQIDQKTARLVETLDWQQLDGNQACGCRPMGGLLWAAKKRGMRCRAVDLRNSGDTSGGRDRVVGYGAFVLTAD
ncbi:MAG TPA: AmmeMemoRadiSam system protein B [Candidatus Acidoferrum sp.]|nr:AmmeMemoRadiSam system protein B [Candidatus Acidoferrum sp.]